MEELLVAAGQRGSDVLALGRAAPVGRRGDPPVVGREADEQAVGPSSGCGPAGRRSARRPLPCRWRGRRRRGSCAPRPRRGPGRAGGRGGETSASSVAAMWRSRRFHDETSRPVHLAVVLLGVADEDGVLLGEEELVLGGPPVTGQDQVGAPPQVDELGDDLLLARQPQVECDGLGRTAGLRRRRGRSSCTAPGRRGPRRGRRCRGRRRPPPSRRAGCRGRGRRSAPWSDGAAWASLRARSHSTKPTTSRLRHIHAGKRSKSASARVASASDDWPMT